MKRKERNRQKNGRGHVWSVRELCLYTCLGDLIFILKMIMASLPNIEPVTLCIILLAVVFGRKALWAVGVYIALELLVWGISLWSVCYLYLWPGLFFLAYALRKEDSAFVWACIAALFGFGFGALGSLPQFFLGGWTAAFSWWQAGLFFDLLHGAGNFVLTLLVFTPLKKTFEILKKRWIQKS